MTAKLIIGNNIQRWREFRGMKQEYIADQLGITKTAFSNIETGKTDVSINRLEAIAQLLKIEPFGLFSSPQDIFQSLQDQSPQVDKSIIDSFNAQLQAKDNQIEQLMKLLSKQQ